MAKSFANDIEIEFDTFGERTSPPVVLSPGLGLQMVSFDEEFCQDIADRGHFVIRYDYRDVGLSTKFDEAGIPNFQQIIRDRMNGKEPIPAYTVDDMANDLVGILDTLEISTAHLCGTSFGSVISQKVAINHSDRVSSLTLIYGNSGNPELPRPEPPAQEVMFSPVPQDREKAIEHVVGNFKKMSGSGFPFQEDWVRKLVVRQFERSFYPAGRLRHLLAVMTCGDRRAFLRTTSFPTLVVQGTDDPMVPVEAAYDLAECIKDSEMVLIEGMGHDLPHKGAWVQIVDLLVDHMIRHSR